METFATDALGVRMPQFGTAAAEPASFAAECYWFARSRDGRYAGGLDCGVND